MYVCCMAGEAANADVIGFQSAHAVHTNNLVARSPFCRQIDSSHFRHMFPRRGGGHVEY